MKGWAWSLSHEGRLNSPHNGSQAREYMSIKNRNDGTIRAWNERESSNHISWMDKLRRCEGGLESVENQNKEQ